MQIFYYLAPWIVRGAGYGVRGVRALWAFFRGSTGAQVVAGGSTIGIILDEIIDSTGEAGNQLVNVLGMMLAFVAMLFILPFLIKWATKRLKL